MDNLQTLSDQELDAKIAAAQSQQTTPNTNGGDLSKLSDDELNSRIAAAQGGQSTGKINMTGENFTGDPSEAMRVLNSPLKKTITGKSFEQDAIDKTLQPGYVPQANSRPFDKYVSGGAGQALKDKAFNDVTAGQEADLFTTPSMMANGLMKLSPEMEAAHATGNYNNILKSHTDAYRKILNPGKPIINSTNIDVDNAAKTLAKEGVVIKTDVTGKLDNTDGIKQLQEANKPLYDEANHILESSPDKQFDLRKIGFQAKINAGKYIKNAEERIAAKNQINSAIKAEISENGGNHMVDAPTVYRIKQGMYERAYKPLEPTSNDGARAIGSTIKDQIEKAFPESPIKEINQKIGNRLEAQTLLEKTNGNSVQGGKLAKGLGRVIGGGVGAAAGSHFGPLGIGGGTVVGQEMGARAVSYMNDPERLTNAMASKMKGLVNPEIPNTTRPGVITPEVMGGKDLPSPKPIGIKNESSGPTIIMNNPIKGLPDRSIQMGSTTRSGINRPWENNALPSPRNAGQSSGPTIKQGTDYIPPEKPSVTSEPKYGTDNAYNLKYQMRAKDNIPLHPAEAGREELARIYPPAEKGNPNISAKDLQDFNDMKDWELSQNTGGVKVYGGKQTGDDRSVISSGSGHSEAFKKVSGNSEKVGFDLIKRASNGEEMTPGEQLKIKMMIHDFRKNIKPKIG